MKSRNAMQHSLLREHFLKEISEGVLFFVRHNFCHIVKSIKERVYEVRYKDAEIVYSLQHKKLLELASKAGAIYRMDGTVLINRDIFDEYLERFHEPSTLASQEEEK